MSERIKRYAARRGMESDAYDPKVIHELLCCTFEPRDTGSWCHSADVAAIEAENARLRLVEDAADSMATALILFRPETMHSADVKRRALAAYDAAKAQATQQGEKKE